MGNLRDPYTPPKTNMPWENPPFEDVWILLKMGDFPMSCSFSGVKKSLDAPPSASQNFPIRLRFHNFDSLEAESRWGLTATCLGRLLGTCLDFVVGMDFKRSGF